MLILNCRDYHHFVNGPMIKGVIYTSLNEVYMKLIPYVSSTKVEIIHDLTGSVVCHRSIARGFKPRLGYVRRVFRLSLRLITC